MKKSITDSNKIDAPESSYLSVRSSQLPSSGNGIHTAIDIYKDEIISIFKGKILTDSQAKFRADKNKDQYFIQMTDGRIMDSKKIKCFAKYANDASGFSDSGFKNNSKIALDESENICLIALRNIKSGEEIFCSYGKKYWVRHR